MKILDYVNTNTYAWAGPVFFSIFILGAVGIGFIHGAKTASYFGAFNLFGVIATTIIIALTFNKLSSLIPGDVTIGKNNIPIGTILKSAKNTIKSFVMTIATFSAYGIFLFLSIVLYFFFRKRLKKNIKQVAFKASLINRASGGVITLLYMLPFIMTTTSFLTIFSESSLFTDVTSTLTKGVTANQISDLRKKSVTTYEAVKNIQEVMKITNSFHAIFGAADSGDGEKAIKEILNNDIAKDALKFLLTQDAITDNLDLISVLNPDAIDNVSDSTLGGVNYVGIDGSKSIEVTKGELSKITNAISKLINKGKNSNVTQQGVLEYFVDKIKLFKTT